jgi:hypothetical protein
MADQTTSKNNVKYVPPSSETIDTVARNVCRRLADSDPSFNEPDVVYGFASFLRVVAKMHTNNRNKRSKNADPASLDTDT